MTLELLRAMNARDTVALRRFVEEHFVTSGPDVPTPAVRVARLGAIRTNLGQLEFQKLAGQTERSAAEDLDMVQAISSFQSQQTGYDAALKSYSMVQRMSLFQYISA